MPIGADLPIIIPTATMVGSSIQASTPVDVYRTFGTTGG
jgi:hypothetical protein